MLADFNSAFLPLYSDETKRMDLPAQATNQRRWRLETEADMTACWMTEVSNIVLAAWSLHPPIVQTCQTNPLRTASIPQNVDLTYAMYIGSSRIAAVIGEAKRNLIKPEQGRNKRLSEPQQKLAKELRGFVDKSCFAVLCVVSAGDSLRHDSSYADKYECPQVLCWDGQCLLMLQFRAAKAEDVREENCPVDCWVLPRDGTGYTLRYALYRFIVQGVGRCVGLHAGDVTVGGVTSNGREYFTGLPFWPTASGPSTTHPGGFRRLADSDTGALYWSTQRNAHEKVWETGPLW